MSEIKKTIMVILDGYDYEYIQKHMEQLPFFECLSKQGKLGPLESVVPADSIPAWTSIYTGMNPAEHGVLESIDYLDMKKVSVGDHSLVQGNTFWDILSNQGKKVFVFNPFMAYPAWDINGLMICGPVFEGGDISTNHFEKVDLTTMPSIGGMVDHPTKKEMTDFYQKTMELSQKQFDTFHKYFRAEEYDFAFLGITTPDRMQHFLWRYTDEQDVRHPKNNNLKDSILKMYQLMEANVEKIMALYRDTHNIIIISDHGHGRRCEKTFYVNQWLIKQGLISDKSKKKRMIEYTKNMTFKILATLRIVEPGTRFFKKFKFAHKVKNADYVFSSNKKQMIYVPKFDGCNPYGGIMVNRSFFESEEAYEAMRQRIIDGLYAVEDHGMPIMLWAKRREDIYQGNNVENYPDVVYLMKPEYGVDRGLFGERLFGISAMHEVVSGGHKPVGVIMGNREDIGTITSILQMYEYVLKVNGASH